MHGGGGGRVGLGEVLSERRADAEQLQRLERQRPRRLKRPGKQVPGGRCGWRGAWLPTGAMTSLGLGTRARGCATVPLSPVISGKRLSLAQFSQGGGGACRWLVTPGCGLWCGARRVPLGCRLLSRAAHGSRGSSELAQCFPSPQGDDPSRHHTVVHFT